mmetsp:Transcript_90823/g.293199  ORF Transcript_90823/g.293199 Transcript_90823/m.293199 type:complete len:260 (+) Transcript_90823:3924-4703(+)
MQLRPRGGPALDDAALAVELRDAVPPVGGRPRPADARRRRLPAVDGGGCASGGCVAALPRAAARGPAAHRQALADPGGRRGRQRLARARVQLGAGREPALRTVGGDAAGGARGRREHPSLHGLDVRRAARRRRHRAPQVGGARHVRCTRMRPLGSPDGDVRLSRGVHRGRCQPWLGVRLHLLEPDGGMLPRLALRRLPAWLRRSLGVVPRSASPLHHAGCQRVGRHAPPARCRCVLCSGGAEDCPLAAGPRRQAAHQHH